MASSKQSSTPSLRHLSLGLVLLQFVLVVSAVPHHQRATQEAEDTNRVARSGEEQNEEKTVGYCKNGVVYMSPGNTRKFWSYGYVTLGEPYPANCTLKYAFNMRTSPSDAMARYGFKVTGTFVGPNQIFSSCSDTDYVYIDDGIHNATFCGNSNITFTAAGDFFEFHFKSQEGSPRGKGFFVTVETYYLCGGTYTHLTHGPFGTIQSPMHSDLYPGNVACSWYFSTTGNTAMTLHCSAFELESQQIIDGNSTCTDSLSITSEAGSSAATSHFCSTDLAAAGRIVYSKKNYMLVTFVSDDVNHHTGFKCTYEFLYYAY